MWSNLKSRDKVMEELRIEVSRQSDRYDNLWLVHEALLEEAHKLHSEVIALRLIVRVGGAGDGSGSRTRAPGSCLLTWRVGAPVW